jgi:hypothetical protein
VNVIRHAARTLMLVVALVGVGLPAAVLAAANDGAPCHVRDARPAADPAVTAAGAALDSAVTTVTMPADDATGDLPCREHDDERQCRIACGAAVASVSSWTFSTPASMPPGPLPVLDTVRGPCTRLDRLDRPPRR